MKVFTFKINDDHATVRVPAETAEAAQHKLLTALVDGRYLVDNNKYVLTHEEN